MRSSSPSLSIPCTVLILVIVYIVYFCSILIFLFEDIKFFYFEEVGVSLYLTFLVDYVFS